MDTNDLLSKVKQIGSEVAENAVDAYKKKAAIKKVGAITLDDENQVFKVDRNGRSGGDFAKKATLAMFTGGMSLVGEAAIKGIKNSNSEWIPYELLIDFNYVVNNQKVTSRESSSVRISKGVRVGSGTKELSQNNLII